MLAEKKHAIIAERWPESVTNWNPPERGHHYLGQHYLMKWNPPECRQHYLGQHYLTKWKPPERGQPTIHAKLNPLQNPLGHCPSFFFCGCCLFFSDADVVAAVSAKLRPQKKRLSDPGQQAHGSRQTDPGYRRFDAIMAVRAREKRSVDRVE